ncbi:hypothetical protein D3C71_2101790 [compost metagenome]
MHGGIGDVEARTVGLQRLGEAIEIGTNRRIGHADDIDAMRPQQRLEIEVAWIVDDDGIARFEQEPTEKIDRLGA